MKRRTFLLGMLAAMMLPDIPARAKEEFTIVLATDLHYISPSLTDNGAYFTRMVENADGKVMTKIEPLTEAFIEEMIALRPDALILSGDLTFNGARKSHEDLTKKLARIRDAGVRIFVLPGNHDLYMRISGRMDLAPQNETLLARWMEQGVFFTTYLNSIFAEPPKDHTVYDLSW